MKGRGRNNTRLSAAAMEKKTRIRVTDDQDEEKEISEAIEGMMELCKIGESEEVSEESFEELILSNQELVSEAKTKTEKMYERYQNMWFEYRETNEVENELDDKHLLEFFQKQKYNFAPSTIWVIYSCINTYYVDTHNINLKTFPRLTKYLKNITSKHVSKKSMTLDSKQVDMVISTCMDSDDPYMHLMGVCIVLLYFGLLRCSDALKVNLEDVRKNEDLQYEINFFHTRKRKNEGFTFLVPLPYTLLFEKYTASISPKSPSKSRFLKNLSKNAQYRESNMGKNSICKFTAKACELLGIPSKGYTTHCWRRSAATNLADEGVSFVNLKRHGQWASDSVVEGYIANSKILRLEREQKLLPKHRRNEKEREGGEQGKKEGKVEDNINLLEEPDFWDKEEGMEDCDPLMFGFSQMDAPMEYQGATESGIPLFRLTQEPHQSEAEGNREIVASAPLKPPPSESAEMDTEAEAVGPKNDPTTLMKSMMDSILDGSNTKPTGNIFQNCVFNFK